MEVIVRFFFRFFDFFQPRPHKCGRFYKRSSSYVVWLFILLENIFQGEDFSENTALLFVCTQKTIFFVVFLACDISLLDLIS